MSASLFLREDRKAVWWALWEGSCKVQSLTACEALSGGLALQDSLMGLVSGSGANCLWSSFRVRVPVGVEGTVLSRAALHSSIWMGLREGTQEAECWFFQIPRSYKSFKHKYMAQSWFCRITKYVCQFVLVRNVCFLPFVHSIVLF